MLRGIEGRLGRLEERRGGAWRAWMGMPLTRWPDSVLVGFLCEAEGLPLPPSDEAAATWISGTELRAMVAGAREGSA